jgi:hypothetical protein
MKTNASFNLPIEASREVALAIIDQLPSDEFQKVASDIRQRAGRRALSALRQMRSAVRKSGLRKQDFEEAIEEVRAAKRSSQDTTRRL